jgi:ferric-dicitrate binding protein FerR (iron transport regulator)
MSERKEPSVWAWERIEALADGSLDEADRARMHETMREDARLCAAVERARAVRGALRDLRPPPVPAGLLGRLLNAPFPERRPRSWLVVAVPAGIAAAAIAVALLVDRPAPPPEDPQVAAMRDFALAMQYLRESAARTNEEVGGIVGGGVLAALEAGRVSVVNHESDDENGG